MPNASKQALLLNAPKQPIYNHTHQQINYKHSQDSSTPFQKMDKNSNNNINHNTDHNHQEEKAPQTGEASQGRAFLQTDRR